MSSRTLKRIFIVGCPRSGTTLLQSMLAAHSQLHSFPETHFWDYTVPENRFYRLLKIYSSFDKKIVYDFMRKYDLKTDVNMRPFYFTTGGWSKALIKVLDSFTPTGVGGWVEKTPRHLNYISHISAVCPDAYFIHMLREGKDVVASMYQVTQESPKQWGGARDINTCIARWQKDVKRSKQYLGDRQHLFLTYGELVSEKEKVLQRLSEKLNVTFQSKMIEEFSNEAENLIGNEEQWKQANVEGRKAGDKFSQIFTKEEQQYIIKAVADISLEPFHII